MVLDSILCPIDFSDESRNALQWAAALAAKYRTRLTVLNAVDPLLAQAAHARYGVDLAKETEPAVRAFLGAALPPAAAGVAAPAIDVRIGEASSVILETADRDHVDLIVMGTHGLGGARKLFLGSTTEHVLRQTRVPLLTIPAGGPHVLLDASGPRFSLESIVAATDFSDASRDAVSWAAEFAHDFAARLVVTHVVAPVVVPTQWQVYVESADEERVREARERLEKWLKNLPRKTES